MKNVKVRGSVLHFCLYLMLITVHSYCENFSLKTKFILFFFLLIRWDYINSILYMF